MTEQIVANPGGFVGNPGTMKEQVVDQIPKVFRELKFGIHSNQDLVNQAVLEVSDHMLYNVEQMRQPVSHGPLDTRLVGYTTRRRCDAFR